MARFARSGVFLGGGTVGGLGMPLCGFDGVWMVVHCGD